MTDAAMDHRTRQNRHILISGASVAGPALAWWLARHGFRPTVVERAPQLRGGGYAVDFRGAALRPHLVLEAYCMAAAAMSLELHDRGIHAV